MLQQIRDDIKNWLLKSPYNGVIWLAWLYVVLASLYAGGGPFSGDLVWFDDRVRLVQIFDWLNGQSWHDRTIMRVNAPEGFHTIWSRVVDLPAAGIIAALQNNLGQMRAAMVASIIMPLLQVLMLFFAASYFASGLVGRQQAKLVTLFVIFTSCINPEEFTSAGFAVGMIGHHSWYLLLTLMLFGAIGRLIVAQDMKSVLIGGFSIGGLLTIGIECFPLIAGLCLLVGSLSWFYASPRLALNTFWAIALGGCIGLALLPANQPLEHIFTVSFAEPSILGSIIIFSAAVFFAAEFFILQNCKNRKYLSVIAIIIVGASISALLLNYFPQFLHGGAAGLSPEERALALSEHDEAKTLFHVAENNLDYMRMILPSLMATCFACFWIKRLRDQTQQAIAIYYVGLLLITFALASIYSRFFHYVSVTESPWLLLMWLSLTEKIEHDEYYALKRFGLYVALGPLWLWLIPAANYDFRFGSNMLLFPAKLQTSPQKCDTKQFTGFLNARYGSDKKIIVPMYKSDEFLLHTKMNIFFLANFPSQNKFIEAKAFYETQSPEKAHQIATDHGINLVAVCKDYYHISEHSERTNQLLRGHMNFGQLLVTGNAPNWLKPVDVAASGPWMLYEVEPKRNPESTH